MLGRISLSLRPPRPLRCIFPLSALHFVRSAHERSATPDNSRTDGPCRRLGLRGRRSRTAADAVYFGLQGGFNARARAANFSPAELPELMTFLRTRGVKGYLTLNTLIFGDELEEAERVARVAIAAGIDAVLVQDLGLLRLLGRLCPELPCTPRRK